MECITRNVLCSNLVYNIFSKINTFCDTETTLTTYKMQKQAPLVQKPSCPQGDKPQLSCYSFFKYHRFFCVPAGLPVCFHFFLPVPDVISFTLYAGKVPVPFRDFQSSVNPRPVSQCQLAAKWTRVCDVHSGKSKHPPHRPNKVAESSLTGSILGFFHGSHSIIECLQLVRNICFYTDPFSCILFHDSN